MTPHNITIIGAGTMGGGIAIGCLAAGLPTTAIDTTEAALDTLRQRVTAHFARQAEKGRITAAQAEAACALLRSSTGLDAASGADLVIEAVFEDLDIKLDLFRRLAPHLSDGAIVATNTSALRVTDLAAAIPDPARFLGLHYFSPAEVNPLVEVVSGPDTTPDTVLAALTFLDTTGKTALPCRDANGFAVNRFFCPYTNEAARLLDEGLASTAQIDAVVRDLCALPLGPFAVMNIIKPRINLNAIRNLGALGPFYAPADSMIATGEAGESWPIDGQPAPLAPDTAALVADRLRAALFLPVLEALAEGVADPEDFDTGARLALRFGNPPVAQMRALGQDRVVALVTPLCTRYGAPLPEAGLNRVFE